MIKSTLFQSKLITVFCLILVSIVLQGCGSDRAEPFDPKMPCSSSSTTSSSSSTSSNDSSLSSSSSSSSVSSCNSSSSTSSSSSSSISSSSSSVASAASEAVTFDLISSGAGVFTGSSVEHKAKSLQIVNETDFAVTAAAYVSGGIPAPDFSLGQVILVDDGETDNCSAHTQYQSISSEAVSDSSIKVIVTYKLIPTEPSPCTTFSSHPFHFFHINTKKVLIFEENISP